MSGDRTNPPSKKKLASAKKKGDVLKTPIFSQACAILGGLGGAWVATNFFFVDSGLLLEWPDIINDPNFAEKARTWLESTAGVVVCGLVAAGLLASAAEFLQVGFVPKQEFLNFKVELVDPFKGVVRIAKSLGSVWFELLKFVVLAFCAVLVLSQQSELVAGSMSQVGGGLGLLQSSLQLSVLVLAALTVMGIADFFVRRQRRLKNLSMSHEEVRREAKEEQGDPQLKSHRRSVHQDLLWEEVVERVKHSRVIIVSRQAESK